MGTIRTSIVTESVSIFRCQPRPLMAIRCYWDEYFGKSKASYRYTGTETRVACSCLQMIKIHKPALSTFADPVFNLQSWKKTWSSQLPRALSVSNSAGKSTLRGERVVKQRCLFVRQLAPDACCGRDPGKRNVPLSSRHASRSSCHW